MSGGEVVDEATVFGRDSGENEHAKGVDDEYDSFVRLLVEDNSLSISTEPPAYELNIGGVISLSDDVCDFDETKRNMFISATKATLEMELLASNLPGGVTSEQLEVEILRFCSQSYITGGGRKLQQGSSNWQIEYNIIVSNILCGSAGCADNDDTNAIGNLVTSISDTIGTYVQSGDFVSQVAQNSALQNALSTGFFDCLVAWGTVYATSASQITQSQGAPLPTNTARRFYPVSNTPFLQR